MKKIVFAIATLLLSSQVYAASTLRIPVFIEGEREPIPAAVINQELAAVGAPLLPEYLEVSNDENGYDKANALHKQIGKTLKALGAKYEYVGMTGGLIPGEHDTAQYFTCYKGSAQEVVEIVRGLTDTVYSDQLQLWGYKSKNITEYLFTEQDDEHNEEVREFLNSESALWKNWNNKSNDLLILSAIGDSGDDVNESLIKVCK